MVAATKLRSGVASLTTLALADLAKLWPQITVGTAASPLHDVMPALVTKYGMAAATLAADWYDDERDRVNPASRFRAIPADLGDAGAHALVGWATTKATDDAALRALVAGGVQRRLAGASRQTVMGSSLADPAAEGWQRQAAGDTCGFCLMLASRGAVYSEQTADFAAHDDCDCIAVPAWGGRPRPVQPFTPSPRQVSDADKARARAWIARNL